MKDNNLRCASRVTAGRVAGALLLLVLGTAGAQDDGQLITPNFQVTDCLMQAVMPSPPF